MLGKGARGLDTCRWANVPQARAMGGTHSRFAITDCWYATAMSDPSPYKPNLPAPVITLLGQSNVPAAIVIAAGLLLAGLMSWHPWSGTPEPRMTTVTKVDSDSLDIQGNPKEEYKIDCVQAGEQLTCDWGSRRRS